MASRTHPAHRCSVCGAPSVRWAGRCPVCDAWNSLVEETVAEEPARGRRLAAVVSGVDQPVALAAVDVAAAAPRPTGLPELDRVLGGGLVPGSVTLLGGEPGVGKSTLLLQVLRARAASGSPVLLVSAEESAQQVRLRAERLGDLPERLFVLSTTDVAAVAPAADTLGAELVVVDSVQAVRDGATNGAAGSVAQVRACAELLVELAKVSDVPVVLVGHVTKEGALAGPRLLEHMVDTVLTVEGDRHHALRTVRAVKHRFGPTGELGLFEMGEGGLGAVADPHRLLLGDRRPGEPGSTVLATVEGQRALLVEVQALAGRAAPQTVPARRQAQGLPSGRLAQLLAVLDRCMSLDLDRRDVFASVVGGIKVAEPAVDLALTLALASAVRQLPLPPDLVAFGEVGLGGEIRQVPDAPRRLAEAARLGFRYALVPGTCPDAPRGMRLLRVGDVGQALSILDASGAV